MKVYSISGRLVSFSRPNLVTEFRDIGGLVQDKRGLDGSYTQKGTVEVVIKDTITGAELLRSTSTDLKLNVDIELVMDAPHFRIESFAMLIFIPLVHEMYVVCGMKDLAEELEESNGKKLSQEEMEAVMEKVKNQKESMSSVEQLVGAVSEVVKLNAFLPQAYIDLGNAAEKE